MLRQVNLLPREMLQVEHLRSLRSTFLLVMLPILFVLLIIHALLNLSIRGLEESGRRPATWWFSPEMDSVQDRLEAMGKNAIQFMTSHKELLTGYVHHENTRDLLTRVGNSALNKVWFREVKLNNGSQKLELYGASYQARLVSEFMLELKKIPYFDQVELVSMGKESRGANEEIDFQITCLLK